MSKVLNRNAREKKNFRCLNYTLMSSLLRVETSTINTIMIRYYRNPLRDDA